MLLRFAKVIVFVSLLVVTGSVFVTAELENGFLKNPRAPDAQAQKTLPFHTKGIVGYVTPTEQETVSNLHYAIVISLALIAGILVVSWGRVLEAKWPWESEE